MNVIRSRVIQDLLQVDLTTADSASRSLFSASTIAFGYVVNCTKMAESGLKRLGRFCYIAATALCACRTEKEVYRLAIGGEEHARTLTGLLISNTRHSANFEVFPGAAIDDGIFEVMELRAGFASQILHSVSILSRTHLYSPVRLTKTPSLKIRLPKALDLLVDGELIPEVTGARITILPKRLKCWASG